MDRLTELIIGSKLEDSYDEFKHPVENPELILDVKDLHYSEHGVTKVDKVNFSIRGGETPRCGRRTGKWTGAADQGDHRTDSVPGWYGKAGRY